MKTTARSYDRGVTWRKEGHGYVVFIPGEGDYFWANETAIEVLRRLRARDTAESVTVWLSSATNTTFTIAADWVTRITTSLGEDVVDEAAPVWETPIFENLASTPDVGTACQTFGMPF